MAARRIRGVRLTREERLEVRRLIGNGSSFEQAAVAARCSTKTVQRVSHETIYQSLFVQSRGALRKELSACLRSKRTRRRPHGRKDPGGYIKDMVLISDRPAEVEDRAVPGHWEVGLILGRLGQ